MKGFLAIAVIAVVLFAVFSWGQTDVPVQQEQDIVLDLNPNKRGYYEDYSGIIAKWAARFNVPVEWIRSIINVEQDGTVWQPNAFNPADPQGGAHGLMQILFGTAEKLGFDYSDHTFLFDPDVNIFYGTKLLQELRGRFGDDFRAVASAYNSGQGSAYKSNVKVGNYVTKAVMWNTTYGGPMVIA